MGMLTYFKKEKNFLRKMGHEFSRRFPKVAGQLNYGDHDSDDPVMERLVESVAFLTGNIQETIDGEFPEISTALLGLLYPNLIAPIPSMSIAQFNIPDGTVPTSPQDKVPENSEVFIDTTTGPTCFFRSCYEVDLVPLDVIEASIQRPETFEFLEKSPGIASVLKLRVQVSGGDSIEELGVKKIRFFINGDPTVVSSLFESFFRNLVDIVALPVIVQSDEENELPDPEYLPADSVRAVGFAPDESVIPADDNGHPAYRLIQEYFLFNEKFCFIDILNLDGRISGLSFDLMFLLSESPGVDVNANTFLTRCSPLINLFDNETIVLNLEADVNEYLLVPRPEEEETTEIHSIVSVSKVANESDAEQTVRPFYAFSHEMSRETRQSYWTMRKTESWRKGVSGTESYISFKNLSSETALPDSEMVFIKATCTNRDLAEKVPAGARLNLTERGVVSEVICLKKPTAPISPPQKGKNLWKLISNLSMNFLALSLGESSLNALQSILRPYNFGESEIVEQQILGIRSIQCQPTLRKTGLEGWRGFRQGLEITLEMDPAYYVGSNMLLFSMVIQRFFALWATVNSFTETVVVSTTEEGEWKRWSPLEGMKPLL